MEAKAAVRAFTAPRHDRLPIHICWQTIKARL
jgi:hypothetical protein